MIGPAYTLVYDYENRLVEVKQGETVIASFLYDADGNRVKGIVNGVSTVYIGGVYEQTGTATIRYYGEAGAMRRAGFASSNGAFYMLQDQVKSTSVIASRAGAQAARQHYYPFGGNRGGSAFSALTSKRFTGQYHEAGLPGGEGLSYYNARWYDPQLGRFVSPDTIVPNPADPQDLNRFTYAGNNPVLYNDPSGHLTQTQLCECFGRSIVIGVTQQWQAVKQNMIRWSDFFDGFLQLTSYTRNPSSYTADRMVEEGLRSGNASASRSRLTSAYLYAAYGPPHLDRSQIDASLLQAGTLDSYTR